MTKRVEKERKRNRHREKQRNSDVFHYFFIKVLFYVTKIPS